MVIFHKLKAWVNVVLVLMDFIVISQKIKLFQLYVFLSQFVLGERRDNQFVRLEHLWMLANNSVKSVQLVTTAEQE